jgi:pimeloyl-ACP methyl ester carboxylesterase
MMRRHFIAGGAGAALARTSRAAPSTPCNKTGERPIVLVHGAWHGGWCWQRLVPLLAAAGHRVFTPTLTGLGDRAHLKRPDIDLDLHTRDVQALFDMEDLSDAVLVGHSYAGFVISQLAERIRPRIRRLVYLDAFVPGDRKSLLDYITPPERRAALVKSGRETGYVPAVPLPVLGVVRPQDLMWAQARVVPQPYASFTQPVRLRKPAGNGLPRDFIACTNPASDLFGHLAARLREDSDWKVHELATGNDAMIVDPVRLAALLLNIVHARPETVAEVSG